MGKGYPFQEAALRDARINRVCACEDLNFWWDKPELKEMKKMWGMNYSVKDIAKHFDRDDPDEVLLALIHLAREEKIVARKTGLKGE